MITHVDPALTGQGSSRYARLHLDCRSHALAAKRRRLFRANSTNVAALRSQFVQDERGYASLRCLALVLDLKVIAWQGWHDIQLSNA